MNRRLRAAIAAISVLAFVFYLTSGKAGQINRIEQLSRRQEVVAAFEHAWTGYSTHCAYHDTLHPVSNTCDDDFGGWGATAIDALSTAIIMDREEIVLEILRFVESLEFSEVKGGTHIQLFETTIRHFGGLLSAWDLLNGPFKHMARNEDLRWALYEKMVRLGKILTCAFDTKSGVPRNWVDPNACASDDGQTNTVAGVGSLILEFARLSDITGDQKYAKTARTAEQHLLRPRPAYGEPFPGLLATFIDVESGFFVDTKGSWGALSDSFYEYLLKMYIYNGKDYFPFLARWKLAADSTIRHLASHPYGRPDLTFLPFWQGQKPVNAMDALSWFAGANFILGGMVTNNQTLVDFGLSIADTGGSMYQMTATGLGGEFVWWTQNCSADWGEHPCTAENSFQVSTLEFNLRPEVLETWYYAYRATKNQKYREWTWSAFQAIDKYCKTPSGFSSISDVTAIDGGDKLDRQESFLYAEVFKYIYLILSDDDEEFQVQDSRKGLPNTWVFNTEGHPLKVHGNPI